MDFLVKYGIEAWIFLRKTPEYLFYFCLFFMLFMFVCSTNITSKTSIDFPWTKNPSLVLHVATFCFVSIVSFKKEHLSKTNLIVILFAIIGFTFGYYGVPSFIQLK